MLAIRTSDPIFGTVAQQTNPTFMADVVRPINESPSLMAEIAALDSTPSVNGNQAVIMLTNNTGEGGDSYYHAPQISISALVNYDDSGKPYAGGSFTSSFDALTPAATFVGILAHEIGHWLDANLAPIYTQKLLTHYSIEQSVATEFASEGKAAYSQYLSKQQIDSANAGVGTGLFHASNSLQQDSDELRLVSGISDVGQAQSYLGSQFWNVNVNGGTYLSTMWSGYSNGGSVNYLGIDYTTITNVTVQLNDAGAMIGSTLRTADLNYTFSYGAIGSETASILNSAGNLLYTEVFNDSGAAIFDLARSQSNGSFTQTSQADETVAGDSNVVTDAGNSLVMRGSGNYLMGVTAANDTIIGNGNVYFGHSAASSSVQLSMSGRANEAVLGAGAATISGSAVNSTVFGGAGALHYDGDGGTLVLNGAATVAGAAANTVVFGGTGTLIYDGSSGYDDVIMSTGSATITAGAGGGWYEGGSNGFNLIRGSDSGQGTVLDAGGNGDTVTGGIHGGDYLLAGIGNETLIGGNDSGTQTMFLGGGSAMVTTGTASSIIDTGTGSAYIKNLGHGVVYGGTGQADVYTAGAGHMDIVGFRVGTDHVAGSVASIAYLGNNTTLQLSNGASITLMNLQTHAFA